MIRLATRIAFGGGRQAAARMAATAVGLTLGTALLLFAGVTFPALHAHDIRAAWRTTSTHNHRPAQNETSTDPLLWRLSNDHFRGHPLIRVDVAAEGSRAPLPPGLARLPGSGQIAVSPALQRLMASVPADELGERFPGRVSAVVGPLALLDDQDLVVFVGHAPNDLRGQPGVVEVHSIESAPDQHNLSDILRVVVVLGAVGLTVPILVFVATATRLGAARREQRLAALRLIGASPGQIATIAAVETAVAATVGTTAGFLLFSALRPVAARIPFDGSTFYPEDLSLAPLWTATIAVGVGVLAVLTAVSTLRRVRLTPLGVARATRRPQPSPRGLIPLSAGVLLLTAALAATASTHAQPLLAVAGLAFAIVIVGIVTAGPWLTARVAAGMARAARRAPMLLAARRLQDDPSGGFRSISGLVLATFVASVFSGLAPALTAGAETTGHDATGGKLFAIVGGNGGGLAPNHAETLIHTLATTPGVTAVIDLRRPPAGAIPVRTGLSHTAPPLILARCSRLAAAATCHDPNATATLYLDPVASGQVTLTPNRPSPPIPVTALDTLPLQGIIALTTGTARTIELVRTSIETAAPGSTPITDADVSTVKRALLTQLQRLTTVALLLTLLVAGCSLAIATAAGLIERQRPFALLRLTGASTNTLYLVVLGETVGPLVVSTAVSATLGLTVADLILRATGAATWHKPSPVYWYALGTGVSLALLIVITTLPLLKHLSTLETTRFG